MNIFNRKPQHNLAAELPPAPPPRGAAQQIPVDQFHSPAARNHTRQNVDMLVASKGYNAYNKHRLRFENTTYLSAFGLLGLFGCAYADFIAIIAINKVPNADAVGTLLLVSPQWLAVTLTWLAILVLYPCAFMTPWSSLFCELDDWADVKGVLFFQSLAIAVTSVVPYYNFGSIHQPARTLEDFCWNFAAISVPTIVGFAYYLWRSQHWQRAVGFSTIPLWVVPCAFGLATIAGYDLVHNGRESVFLNPLLLVKVVLNPSMTQMKHLWGLFHIHSWTALVFSYMWYMLPKFV